MKEIDINKKVGRLLSEYTFILLLYNVFRRLLNLNKTWCVAFAGCLLLAFLLHNVSIIMTILLNHVILYIIIFFALVYLIGMIQGDVDIEVSIKYFIISSATCAPMFVSGFMINDKEKVYELLKKRSFIITLFASFILLTKERTSYNMQFSYRMLPILLIYTNEYISTKKCRYLILTAFVFSLSVLFGSRGAILCFGIFLILRLYTFKGNKLLKFIGLMVTTITLTGYQIIGNYILKFMEIHGIYNRTLSLLFSNITYTSGRADLQHEAISLLKEKMFFGRGAASDMNLIGTYPHNIFIEILYDYGVIIGTVSIMFLGTLIILFLLRSKKREISLVFLGFCFFPLLLSGTYLRDSFFWFLIGMMFKEFIAKK